MKKRIIIAAFAAVIALAAVAAALLPQRASETAEETPTLQAAPIEDEAAPPDTAVNDAQDVQELPDESEDAPIEDESKQENAAESIIDVPIVQEASDEEIPATACTLSVRCDSIFERISSLDPDKVSVLPDDGVIFAEKTVEFSDGESVFDVLKREMKNAKIHLEFTIAPLYNTAYIEGIANLYEFDCGELSGWMYRVNGKFPNYGCSAYKLQAGDKIEWLYTCDLGRDIGNEYGGSQWTNSDGSTQP